MLELLVTLDVAAVALRDPIPVGAPPQQVARAESQTLALVKWLRNVPDEEAVKAIDGLLRSHGGDAGHDAASRDYGKARKQYVTSSASEPSNEYKSPNHGHAWQLANGHLSAGLQLARVDDDGSLLIPPRYSTVVLEIGANSRNTLDQILDRNISSPNAHAFLLTFEPLLDKFATLLARNSRADVRTELGFHNARGIALPFAVSHVGRDGWADLKISGKMDGCASLLHVAANYFSSHCTNTSGVLETRRVPAISLRRVLSTLIPSSRSVAFAKIDAQGADVALLRAAGAEALERIHAVQVEVVRDRMDSHLRCPPQYRAGTHMRIACVSIICHT